MSPVHRSGTSCQHSCTW